MGQKINVTAGGTVLVPNDVTVKVNIPGGGTVNIQPAPDQVVNELKIDFTNKGGG